MTTDQLPPELWGRIFEYTCMDDGTMGRSLSLVSRSFYHSSAPYKLQSISVTAHLKHILRFLEALQKAFPIQRRVKYLFLGNNGIVISNGSPPESDSDPEDGYPSSEAKTDEVDSGDLDRDGDDEEIYEEEEDVEYAPLTEEELQDLLDDEEFFKTPDAALISSLVKGTSALDQPEDPQTRLDILILDAIDAILELCSDTLETLSVSVTNFEDPHSGHAFIFPKLSLPRLKELTWIVPISYTYRWPEFRPERKAPRVIGPDPPPRDHPIFFPSLITFHVSDGTIVESHRRWIEHCCPNLRYLRSDFQTDTFEREIMKALKNHPGDEAQVQVSVHTPLSVQLHLMDIWIDDDHRGHIPVYHDLCTEYGVGTKCYIDKRVIFSAKRKDDLKMTEKDWEERKWGNLGETGLRWKPCPSYDDWLGTANLKYYTEDG